MTDGGRRNGSRYLSEGFTYIICNIIVSILKYVFESPMNISTSQAPVIVLV